MNWQGVWAHTSPHASRGKQWDDSSTVWREVANDSLFLYDFNSWQKTGLLVASWQMYHYLLALSCLNWGKKKKNQPTCSSENPITPRNSARPFQKARFRCRINCVHRILSVFCATLIWWCRDTYRLLCLPLFCWRSCFRTLWHLVLLCSYLVTDLKIAVRDTWINVAWKYFSYFFQKKNPIWAFFSLPKYGVKNAHWIFKIIAIILETKFNMSINGLFIICILGFFLFYFFLFSFLFSPPPFNLLDT